LPTVVAVKVTEQLPEARVQDGEEKVPPPFVDQLVIPVGPEPVTVTVQLVVVVTSMVVDTHVTTTAAVPCSDTVSVNVPLLALFAVSPA